MDRIRLRNGDRLLIRPIRETDADALVAMHSRLSTDTIYRRYFGARPSLSAADVSRFTRVPEDWRFALVAVREPAELVAVARYEGTAGGRSAEIAIVVDDKLQFQGIGRALFERLLHVARASGLDALVADVLDDNEPMLALLRATGLPRRMRRENGSRTITVDLTGVALSDAEATRAAAHLAAARAGFGEPPA